MSLIKELKRRNVFRVAIAYLVVSWLVLQIGVTLAPVLNLQDWVNSLLVFFLALGFPVALLFAWAFELTPDGLKREKDIDRSASITHLTSRNLDYTIIAVLILALGYFALDKFVLSSSREAAKIEAALEKASTRADGAEVLDKSIAVLPFVNMSDDAANEYFSDGISEELLNALASIKGLKVAGRTSSFAFKNRDEDLRTIGKILGVTHILEGSVRKSGVKVRITAQLIKAADGFHLWSATYDRELTDIFAIQDEIAQAILGQLKARLIGDQGGIHFTALRADVSAFDLYLEAKQKIYLRRRAPLEQAAELLQQAIAIDPGYAPAYAQSGIVSMLLSEGQYGTIPADEANARAKPLLDKALSLHPKSAEAWAGLGLYQIIMQEPEQAKEALLRALAINPSLVNARHWLGRVMSILGERDEVKRIRQEILVRDPLYLPGIGNLFEDYIQYDDLDRAQVLLDRIRPFMPTSITVAGWDGVLHFIAGRVAESMPYFELAYEMEPENATARGRLSRALLWSGQYQRLTQVGVDEFRVYALMRMDRMEEASILAWELADQHSAIAALFRLLLEQQHYSELIEYVESRWPDLVAFEADYPERDGWNQYNYLGIIAHSYRRLGNDGQFDQAMSQFKAALDYQLGNGANNHEIAFAEAVYHVLAGDHESALERLARSFEGGFTVDPDLIKAMPMFAPLEANPRFEEIMGQMVHHMNSERAKLGLAPMGD